MKTKIEKLKTELREFIELSKAITPGKWGNSCFQVYSNNGNDRIAHTGLGQLPPSRSQESENNAVFIANSSNISPAIAECLLVAVETLERTSRTQTCLSGSFTIVPTSEANAAINQLQQILTIWEAAK